MCPPARPFHCAVILLSVLASIGALAADVPKAIGDAAGNFPADTANVFAIGTVPIGATAGGAAIATLSPSSAVKVLASEGEQLKIQVAGWQQGSGGRLVFFAPARRILVAELKPELSNTPLRDKYAVSGREPMLIHPKDAAPRNIKSGDVVHVRSPHGSLLAGAVVTENIAPGHVQISEGGWYDPAEPGNPGSMCKYGCVNVLVDDAPTSQLANGNCGQSGIVQVEKFKGKAPAVTVFAPPKGVAV